MSSLLARWLVPSLMERWGMRQHSQAGHTNFPFLTNSAQMAILNLNFPPPEVSVLIHKGSHTPLSCGPLNHLHLHGRTPFQDASKRGSLDLPAFLSAFDQKNIFLTRKKKKQPPYTCSAWPAPQLHLTDSHQPCDNP